ncbi:MAG: chromosome segregation protein SMC [Streptosporangiales bacterium]|nr:chromosome segregation protein SMC [Streptosporangiales bacterium]
MRGFKSFASATTIRLEPGITCVVGPNGSGKSNILDALSWVMGEQGAKSLRGSKMEDVVFAGTSTRAPLGRAEVTLTIDNSDGALPIDYAEVTISRLMFRSGQSEYAINGDSCRLLDIQDLLSDSGIGREMHVIINQGQLDQILHAGPEARRALIEEASGVLKHRKRKEKALRKLDAMQANLTRLVDLTGELSRRLKPLGRQAEVARRAAVIQADLRDARLRLLADDYVQLRDKLRREEADEAVIAERRAVLEADLGAARASEAELDRAAAAQSAAFATAQQTWFSLSSLTERLRSTAGLATERHRLLSAEPEPERPGRDPDELEAQAAELRAEEEELGERLAQGRDVLSEAVTQRSTAENALAATERRLADSARAAAGRAERLARLRGQADAAESRTGATQEEIDRLTAAADQARARAERAQAEYSEVQDVADGGEDDRSGLKAELEKATAASREASDRVSAARKAERQANSEAAAQRARAEALQETLRRGADATAAVLADPERFRGVAGPFAGRLTVTEGYETAIAAALGAAAEAITVDGIDAAVEVLAEIRRADAGTVGLVIASPAPAPASDTNGTAEGAMASPSVPLGTPALELVEAPAELASAVRELLHDVAVVDDLGEALRSVRDNPGLRAVTREGDLVGAHWAQGGSARPQSLLDVRSAADEAEAKVAAAELASEEAAELLAEATEGQESARQIREEIRGRMQAADAAAAEISGRLGRLAGAARAASDEAKRLDASVGAAERSAAKDTEKLARLKAELAEAEADAERAQDPELENELAEAERTELGERATAARATEMEARLEVRTVEERLRAIGGRADSLTAAAASERAARERAELRRRQRAEQAAAARAVATGAEYAVTVAESSLNAAAARRDEAQAASGESAESLKALRARIGVLSTELEKVTSSAHGTEIARAEHRLRLEQLEQHATEEYGVEPDVLVAEYGPEVGVPVPEKPAEDKPKKRPRPSGGTGPEADSAEAAPAPEPLSLADALKAVTDAAKVGDEPPEAAESGDGDGADAGDPEEKPAEDQPAMITVPYVREEQERRAAEAERQLSKLGKVNPLALEEYAALQERHQFLATQLDDLRKTRRDLLTVVKEVDDRVQEVFASAYADTAREFEGLFSRLFPGGNGRLMLTEPDDMLTTGIEIEARPPGKKVKRLSLLSGGERSLTAIAYLFAIFKARPSPFYVLDEVEAALDDSNLQRLLRVFEEVRETSQLIVITHQRRTMEAADALYGVSMRGDGVSTVISQRVREAEPPKAAQPAQAAHA